MKKMSLSKQKLEELYPNMDLSVFYEYPKTDKDIIEKYLPSKLWRLNNLYTIIDKHGKRIPFVMNKSQHRVYSAKLEHPRLIILKSRQQGISTFFLISFLDDALFLEDMNIGLMAQGKAEAGTLLRRVKLAWEEFPQIVQEFLGISLGKNNSEEFSFANNSTVFIRTSFRSATLQRLHISEFGKIANKYPERAKETKTGTLQAIAPGNDVAIESTAEGDNAFKEMWDAAVDFTGERSGKDFHPIFLSWIDDPDCTTKYSQPISDEQAEYFAKLEDELQITLTNRQKWFWVMQYRELADDIYQEYPSTPEEAFMATKDGAYYGTLYRKLVMSKNREIDDLYDPNLEVNVVIDLGMNDDFVMAFFQRWKNEWRIIDEYRNSGEGLSHYVNVMFDKPYNINVVVLPHDVKVKELNTGQTRLARFRQLGVKRTKVLPRVAVNDGIEAVRRVLPDLYIDPKCTYLISCFKNYSKQWDDNLGVWKDKPLHNTYSHGADTIRYMALSGLKRVDKNEDGYETRAGRKKYVVDGLAM